MKARERIYSEEWLGVTDQKEKIKVIIETEDRN